VAISTFTTLKNAVADFLDRDDLGAVGGPLDTMIGLAEDKLYRELRLRFQEDSTTVAVGTAGTFALPSDFIQARTVTVATGGYTYNIEPTGLDTLYSRFPLRTGSGTPTHYAQAADTLIFGPTLDASANVTLDYYAKPTRLSTSNQSNYLTTNHPDLLFFETLLQSVNYLGADERLPLWRSERDRAVQEVHRQRRRERFSEEQSLGPI
jgi:hypothetical protein